MIFKAVACVAVFCFVGGSVPGLWAAEQMENVSVILDIPNSPVAEIVTPNIEANIDTLKSSGKKVTTEEKVIQDEKIEEKSIVEQAQAESLNSVIDSSGQTSGSSSASRNVLLPETDASTGALIYRYPFSLPPGRGAMTPQISIVYNSQQLEEGSIVGYGWNISTPYIERLNKRGVDQIYGHNEFTSSFSGELVNVGGINYVTKAENGSYLAYTLSNNSWILIDKSGVTYTFGATAAGRQDNPSNPNRIFRWMLEESRDVHGNVVRYEYVKDQGQIYPSAITYTWFEGATSGFRVEFTRSTRPDQRTSYKAGFRVTTNDRITNVVLKHNSVTIRSYALTYDQLDTTRSVLSSITESGTSGSTTTTLPPIMFEYGSDPDLLTQNSSVPVPWVTYTDINGNTETEPMGFTTPWSKMLDINGDGLKDFVASYNVQVSGIDHPVWWVMRNTGNGWVQDTSYQQPTFTYIDRLGNQVTSYFVFGNHMDIGDWNGDMRDDLIYFWPMWVANNQYVQRTVVLLNTGSGWTQDTNFTINQPTYLDINGDTQVHYLSSGSIQQNDQFMDLNGDGALDYIFAFNEQIRGINYPRFIVLYNRDGNLIWDPTVLVPWVTYPTYAGIEHTPVILSDTTEVLDANGDSLPDIMFASNYQQSGVDYPTFWIVLNTGHGWEQDTLYQHPRYRYIDVNGVEQQGYYITTSSRNEWKSFDVNNDGMQDLVKLWPVNIGGVFIQRKAILLNAGGRWDQVDNVLQTTELVMDNGTTRAFPSTGSPEMMFMDYNGDGLTDVVYSSYYRVSGVIHPVFGVLENNGAHHNRLNSFSYHMGGVSSITYQSSHLYKEVSGNRLNPNLPFNISTVKQIVNTDGVESSQSIIFSYAGGEYAFIDRDNRRFAGFSKVVATDGAGNSTTTYFHQGNDSNTSQGEYQDEFHKIGRVYRTEVRDSSSNLMNSAINRWDSADLGQGRKFVKLVRTLNQTWEGGANHRDAATESTYESTNGGLMTRTEWGEVLGQADGSFTDTGLDKLFTNYQRISNTITGVRSFPARETTVGQAGIQVADAKYYYDNQAIGLTKGNLTKVEQWVSGTSYVANTKSYNSYGLVTSETDARGLPTTYVYDSYNLYPVTVTNALGQATQLQYDYASGKLTVAIDPNSARSETTYDGLGRTLTVKVPFDANPAQAVLKTAFTYTNTPLGVSVQQRDYFASDRAASRDMYQYFDGLGRLVQSRTEAEIVGQFSVSDVVFNARGLKEKESLPYFNSGSARTPASTTDALYAAYAYDPVGRVNRVQNAVGATTTAYTPWQQVVTDARGNSKTLIQDAYGRLVRVVEPGGGVTDYTYGPTGLLIGITDAADNVRSFTYDALGRRLTAQDLHAPSDATFGSYSYTYDAAGNLTQKVTPKGETVNYTYDSLNRQLTEDFAGAAGVEVVNTYDTCARGVGRLCSQTNAAATRVYEYDSLGGVAVERATIGGAPYITNRAYDYQGNVTLLTNPDGSQVRNGYNTAGQLESIERKESADLGFTPVVTGYDYGPTGSVITQANANGTTITNTYAADQLYRLRRKLAANSAGVRLQDVAYTYDAVGNITRLIDASQTNAAKTVDYTYDALNRLLTATATGAANGQNYAQTYTYDALGNLLTKSDVGTYQYQGNQGSSFANPHAATQVGSQVLDYDASGNLTSRTVPLPWYPPAGGSGGTWTDRNQITVAKGKVSGGSSLRDFPMLVSLIRAELRNSANGGRVGRSDGGDILFTAADGITKLHHEVERYDGITGTLVAWVRIPQLSASQDTSIIMYYGNSAASPQVNPSGVWLSAAYAAVYHLNGTTGEADSTANVLPLTQSGVVGSASAGKLGSARQLTSSGSSNYLSRADAVGLDGQAKMTIQAWVRRTDSSTAWRGILSKRTSATNQFSYALGIQDGYLRFETGKGNSTDTTLQSTRNVVPANTWTSVSAVFDGVQVASARKKLYVNGSLNATGKSGVTSIANTTSLLRLFVTGGNTSSWVGQLDEVRVLKTALSAGWLQTEYANQSSPDTFCSYGPVTFGAGDTFSWDYANRLVTSRVSGKNSAYAYDASGTRVKLSTMTGTRYYPTPYFNSDGAEPVKHILTPSGEVVATVSGTGTGSEVRFVATDHLSGSSVVTSSSGVQQELMDYYPFGSIRLDEKAGSFSEQRKFTGYEFDADTGLNYAQARYQDPALGKFISQDPLAIEALQTTDKDKFLALLSSPQNWNTYSYALNNPIMASDPSGLLTIYVPGTNYNFNSVANSHLGQSLQNTFNEKPYILTWSGDDNIAARTEAAQGLAKIVNDHKFSDGERLSVVSHSHGGNVVNEATWLFDRKIDNFVSYAMPVLDSYQARPESIANHINVSTLLDPIQLFAGNQRSVGGLLKTVFNPSHRLFGIGIPEEGSGNGEFGIAGRWVPGAVNTDATIDTLMHPIKIFKSYGLYLHGYWQDPKVWQQRVIPYVK